MGIFMSIFTKLIDRRILLLGLDAAGKTTILYKLRLGEVVTTIPTIGFNVETVDYKSLRMTVWDVGGQKKLRALWRHYYQGSDSLIYVVDSCDDERFDEARDELHGILSDDSLRGIPVLIFSNKSDLPRSASVAQIAKSLDLPSLSSDHKWFVQATSAVSGDGLYEGLDWLSSTLSSIRSKNH